MPVIIEQSQNRPARTARTATGALAFPGTFRRGPLTPTLVKDQAELTGLYGPRWATSQSPDLAAAYLRLGGSALIVKRRVGPAAVPATGVVKKGASDSLLFTTEDVGVSGNDIRVEIVADTTAGTAVITVRRITAGDPAVERSVPLHSQQEAVDWSIGSQLLTFAAPTGAAQWPPTTTTGAGAAASGGDDDLDGVTDATLAADLATMDRKLGPRQVITGGIATAAAHDAVLAHVATDVNARGILWAGPGDLASGEALKDRLIGDPGSKRAAMYRGRLVVQGAVPGTYLTVPWDVVQAAMVSRNDAAVGNPNEAAAGELGDPRGVPDVPNTIGDYVVGALDTCSDQEVTRLLDSGLNPIIDLYGDGTVIQTDGDETLADRIASPLDTQFANVRLDMLVVARADAIAQRYRHRQVDGRRRTAGGFGADLVGMLDSMPTGALYALVDDDGLELDPGFVVDVGPGVNTPASIARKELRSRIGLRRSPGARLVYVNVVTYGVGEGLS